MEPSAFTNGLSLMHFSPINERSNDPGFGSFMIIWWLGFSVSLLSIWIKYHFSWSEQIFNEFIRMSFAIGKTSKRKSYEKNEKLSSFLMIWAIRQRYSCLCMCACACNFCNFSVGLCICLHHRCYVTAVRELFSFLLA